MSRCKRKRFLAFMLTVAMLLGVMPVDLLGGIASVKAADRFSGHYGCAACFFCKKITEENLIRCGREEFLEKGYAGANLRNICKRAGVTTGLFLLPG